MAGALNLGTAYASLELRTARLEAGLADANRKFNASAAKIENRAKQMRETLSRDLGSMGRSLTLSVTAPLVALGTAAVKAAVDMDSLKRGLRAVAGSSAETERQLKRLREVAKLPGLGFEEAIRGATTLQAAGLSAQMAERALMGFGNALATVGKGKADLDGVIRALSQIESKGKITAEEINQLAERVPQIRVILKEAFGTADTEVLQKAKVSTTEFFNAIISRLEEMPRVTGGAKNSFENFSDSAKRSLAAIGDVFLPAVTRGLDKISPILEDIAGRFKALSGPAKTAFAGLAIGGALIGPALLGLAAVVTAINNIDKAFKASALFRLLSKGAGALAAPLALGEVLNLTLGSLPEEGGMSPEVRRLAEANRKKESFEREQRERRAAYVRQEIARSKRFLKDPTQGGVFSPPDKQTIEGVKRRIAEFERELAQMPTYGPALSAKGTTKGGNARINAAERAAAAERAKEAAAEAKRMAKERAEALKQYEVDMATFANKFRGMRTAARQKFEADIPLLGLPRASKLLDARLKEIDKEEGEEKRRLDDAHKRKIELAQKRHERATAEELRFIEEEFDARAKAEMRSTQALSELRERLFKLTGTEAQIDQLDAWKQYWKDFLVSPIEAGQILKTTLDNIDQNIIKKWADATAAHFGAVLSSMQKFLRDVINMPVGEADRKPLIDVPFEDTLNPTMGQDTEANAQRRISKGTETPAQRDKAKREAERDRLRELRDRLRNSFGGILATSLADEFGNSFTRRLEKVFGSNAIGRAFARAFGRTLERTLDNMLDSIMGSFGKIGGKGGIGGGLNIMQPKGAGGILNVLLGGLATAGLGGLLGGIFKGGGILKGIGKIFGFAGGGNPPVGRLSLVGERGPELIMPRTQMTVLPNAALAGGGGITINMGGVTMANDMDVRRVTRQIAREIELTRRVRPGRT